MGVGVAQDLLVGGSLPFHQYRLLAAQDGAGSAYATMCQSVFVLADHLSDAAGGGLGVLVDGHGEFWSSLFNQTEPVLLSFLTSSSPK